MSCASDKCQIPDKPNIVWIMAEDMSLDLECYGMAAVKTPNLNLMAQEGVLYNAAVCTNPISSPNRSAMITGATQVVTNTHNHRSNRDVPLNTNFKPITSFLRDAGYTCVIGHHGVFNKGRKTDFNFLHEHIGEWNGVDKFGVYDKYDEFTAEDQPFFATIQLQVTHRGDWWQEVSAASKHPVNPSDVVLPPFMPDHPQVRKEWAMYLDQVEKMDSEVGMIVEELRDKGVLDNTIIFFIGDNGRCDIRGKGYLYEQGLKVPMIAWGRGIKPGVVNNIVSTLDISATILDLAGCEIPAYCDGEPLFDRQSGESIVSHDYIYSARDTWDEVVECSRAVTTDQYKYIRNYFPEIPWDAHQRYLEFHRPALHIMRELKKEGKLSAEQLRFLEDSKPVEELYDLKSDPFESKNLAEEASMQSVLRSMSDKMDEWQATHNDMGIADRNRRTPEAMKIDMVEYVKKYHPERWQYMLDGNVIDFYKPTVGEARKRFAPKEKKATIK